jgi:methylglutaconyl-CoA hydratase
MMDGSIGQPRNVTVTVRNHVARVVLNRPDRHNAFDDKVIHSLSLIFDALARQSEVRAIVLSAEGKSFCAGADLDWMRRCAEYDFDANRADAMALADMLAKLDRMPKPTVALVQGGAYGGGIGLAAACDITVAADDARFALTEVRLGLIPSVISPYVIRSIGAHEARRYFLTAESFGAAEAHRIGLVHQVVAPDDLSAAGDRMVKHMMAAGPKALASAKELIADVSGRSIDSALMKETARRIAEARSSAEGKEGIAAFFDRRAPDWSKG